MKKKKVQISIEELEKEEYATLICYPKPTKAEFKKRLKELQKLGVKAIELSGEKEVFNMPVLGKGCVCIVVIAYINGKRVALKIRRVDADRMGMPREAEMLRMANSINVGPKILAVSKNFLLMQFVDGKLLPEWLDSCRAKALAKRVLRDILEQCWRLDRAGLDHGELSHAPKHIIVDGKAKPCIVDFETASLKRKSSNVTSICQFLFISGLIAKKFSERIGKRDKTAIIEALRRYKANRTRKNFEKVLEACGL
ncbi:MAG: RIO1 family regulatory kinase/ATPase [Candidatus Bathyarchaeota archaeon]|nr:RIO1 family regulatory kinase/ATPase [Candidatus Bathyarchaeota archaeon]